MKRNLQQAHGFTLIEVLVTVAIVGILAAIAIPSYSYYTQRTNRSGAKTTVERVRGLLEQYYINNKTYTTNLTDLGFTNSPMNIDSTGAETTAGNTYYQLSVNVPGTVYCANCSYEIIATPKNTQANDTKCATIWENALGQKGSSTGASDCW